MGVLFLLILIPLFSVGVVLYFSTLIDFAVTGELNELVLLISTLLSVVTSYFIPGFFLNLIPGKNASVMNKKNVLMILSSYISIILLLAFGITMLYRGILNLSVIQIILGVGCVALFIYSTYYYFFYYEKKEFVLQLIMDAKKYKELSFKAEDGNISFYIDEGKFIEGKKYVLEYNRYTNIVKRINGMTLGGIKDEKDNKEKH